ncbi:hypothetical protein [Shewanella surugensis]|uniref:Uncharacterized protein n=1 Tax=Shewanella surugensis TaxID=212020 RepID=A0ABT0L7Q9_9GAMM|nr:hypothetical protein [Shewanella surugensis]MCL1123736.1 hypothetical protein [Shewanella surugensis]
MNNRTFIMPPTALLLSDNQQCHVRSSYLRGLIIIVNLIRLSLLSLLLMKSVLAAAPYEKKEITAPDLSSTSPYSLQPSQIERSPLAVTDNDGNNNDTDSKKEGIKSNPIKVNEAKGSVSSDSSDSTTRPTSDDSIQVTEKKSDKAAKTSVTVDPAVDKNGNVHSSQDLVKDKSQAQETVPPKASKDDASGVTTQESNHNQPNDKSQAQAGNQLRSQVISQPLSCQRALNQTKLTPLLRNKMFGDLVQTNLYIIYQYNKDYQKDRNQRPGTLLSDSIVGRVTERWLKHFCEEFTLNTGLPIDEFVTQFFGDLVIIAELTEIYPDWRTTVETAAFKQWSATQKTLTGQTLTKQGASQVEKTSNSDNKTEKVATNCVEMMSCFGQVTALHILVDKYYLQQLNPAVLWLPSAEQIPQRYYRLTSEDIEQLTIWQTNIAKLKKIVGQTFESQASIDKILVPLLNPLLNTSSKSQSMRQDIALLVHIQPATKKTDDKAAAPAQFYVTNESLAKMQTRLNLVYLSSLQLTVLTQLENKQFLNAYLFKVALKWTNVTALSSSTINGLVELALKNTQKEGGEPLIWQPTANCPCAENISIRNSPQFFYGFSPYWDSTPQSINFSQLTRIGYFSAAVSADYKLQLPMNWKNSHPYSDFIATAHKYRVKVDLVISNEQGVTSGTSTDKGSDELTDQNRLSAYYFNDDLIDDINQTIKQPLLDYPINRVKPLISLGASPVRTMADGVTLNLALPVLTPKEQSLMIDFIKKLKLKLNGEMETGSGVEDRYYVNVMIPANELQKNDGLYTVENLIKIEPYVNLFIMLFEPLSLTSPMPLSEDRVAAMKALRTLFGEKDFADGVSQVFDKTVPLVLTNDNNSALKQVLSYSKWSYLNTAFWTLPLSKADSQLIDSAFFYKGNNSDIINTTNSVINTAMSLATQTCDLICPNRWYLRAGLFMITLIALFHALASIGFYQLRRIYRTWYFIGFICVMAILVMLAFNCDPYWKAQQELIFFIFIILLLAANFFWWIKRNKEGNLP